MARGVLRLAPPASLRDPGGSRRQPLLSPVHSASSLVLALGLLKGASRLNTEASASPPRRGLASAGAAAAGSPAADGTQTARRRRALLQEPRRKLGSGATAWVGP